MAFGFAVAGCGEFDDPTVQERFDPATAPPPPRLAEVPFEENRNLLWGDLHVHSSLSFDSFTNGSRTLPDDAYMYMKGGTIEHAMGYPIRAGRPLDFGAVTDHAKFLGIERHRNGGDTSAVDELREAIRSGSRLRMTWFFLRTFSKLSDAKAREETFDLSGFEDVSRSAWREIIRSAERHNEPGHFTTFVGYEWSSVPEDVMLHRNVIYGSSHVPDFPFSSLDSENPEDLWRALDEQRLQGMDVLAIPHNGNLSRGRMFDSTTYEGSDLTAEYAEARSRNEPLVEIYQVKGTSETHPLVSPDDSFANFELIDGMFTPDVDGAKIARNHSRAALKRGLQSAQRKGFNPFQFGVIGSSDSHNSSSSVEEDNYHGKFPILDGAPSLRLGIATLLPKDRLPVRLWGAAGLIAVWAEENSRASIFHAMQRKETYATSGPRISVRFFAGWEYPPDILEGDWLERAYRGGVPMGGTLEARAGSGPSFIITALKDPVGANLDRVQIIKLWVDGTGQSHERVYDVAASDGRLVPGSDRPLAVVGNSVDVAAASYTNTIGESGLSSLWQDPEFDDTQHALYYARVIEIPTPRHTTFAAKLLDVEAPEPSTLQERAVTSAIWIRPTGETIDLVQGM